LERAEAVKPETRKSPSSSLWRIRRMWRGKRGKGVWGFESCNGFRRRRCGD
jgi:hypothetical protein